MTQRPIIDAGPGLNFLSINQERLLIAVLGKLSAPATVGDEVLRKAAQDPRFRPAAAAWKKLTPNWIQILPDDVTPALSRVVDRLTRQPMAERLKHAKDLGETMVIAHAVVAAEAGAHVIVLIDDGPEHGPPPVRSTGFGGFGMETMLWARSAWPARSPFWSGRPARDTSRTGAGCAISTSVSVASTMDCRPSARRPC